MIAEFETSLFDYLRTIHRGEDILVEYTSKEPIHLFFYILLKYAKQYKIPVIIGDVLDNLYMYKAHLELAGIDTSMIDETRVMKLGGITSTGKVLGKIDLLEEPIVWKGHYNEIIEKVQEEYTWRIILGIEKSLRIYKRDPAVLGEFIGIAFRSDLNDKRRTTITFLNTSLTDKDVIQEFEELASRVFTVKLYEDELILEIVKSINFDEYGIKIKIKAQDLQKSLLR